MTLKQLKEEARKEMCSLLDDHEIGFGEGATTTNILDFINSLITKAYEEGKREILERVKIETDAVQCECGEKWSETDLADYVKEELSNLTLK